MIPSNERLEELLTMLRHNDGSFNVTIGELRALCLLAQRVEQARDILKVGSMPNHSAAEVLDVIVGGVA